jgi:acetyl esterase
MTRQYDKTLVSEIRKKAFIINTASGDEIVCMPVPDDDRKNILDPRILKIAVKKKEVHKKVTFASKFSLVAQRVRPDKVNYDLTESEVTTEEMLIPINGDHHIDVFISQKPSEKNNRPAMVYLHGGGFTAGDFSMYRNAMKLLAEQSDAVIVFPEYRLAPENPFPCGLDDAWGTVKWVYVHADELGVDKNKIVVAGDSAGGNLSLGCEIKDEDGLIKKLILLYPAVDSTPFEKISDYTWSYDMYPVIDENKEYAYNRIDRIKNGGNFIEKYYFGGRTDYKDPLVSAVYYDNLKKFPRTVLVSAEYDYLRVQTDYFASLLKQNDVNVVNFNYLGCDHGFMDNLGIAPQAEEVVLLMADELLSMA